MRVLILALSILIIPVMLPAQTNGNTAVVAAVNMNVLYRGVNNPIEIAVPGIASDKITATVSDGTIKKTEHGWDVVPGAKSELLLSVMVNNNKISEKNFRIKSLPVPTAVFAGRSSGEVSKDEALITPAINVIFNDFLLDMTVTIAGFTLTASKGGLAVEKTSAGNTLTQEMKSLLASCNPGSKILFHDIKAVFPDGKVRELNIIALKLR